MLTRVQLCVLVSKRFLSARRRSLRLVGRFASLIKLLCVAPHACTTTAVPSHVPQMSRFREKEHSIELEMERGDGEFFDPAQVGWVG